MPVVPTVRSRAWLLPVVGTAAAIGAWELATRANLLPRRYLPPATEVLPELVDQAGTGTFWSEVLATLQAWGISLGIALVLGITLGLVIGSNVWADRATRLAIELFRPVPPVALIPVVVLIYGTSLSGAVFLSTFGAVWPLVVQSAYGARFVDELSIDTARSLQLGRGRRFLFVTLPSAAPLIASGIRIASAVALVLVVTSGIIIGTPGTGRAITNAANGGAYSVMYAYVVATGLLGLGLNLVMAFIERRVVYWVPGGHRYGRR